jgi:hypothetical protein
MSKPCGHPDLRPGCRICFWSAQRTPKGEQYRQMFARMPAPAARLAPADMPAHERWLAPGNTGHLAQPWVGLGRGDWRITAVVPHLNTLQPLRVVLELLRLQTARPYVLVIDTGSAAPCRAELEQMRSEDLEVHFLGAHHWSHSSEPVAAANDVGLSLCRTELLYLTHSDVFLRRRDYLADLAGRCGFQTPVVGYRMSDRSWVSEEWRQAIGHMSVMMHAPTILRIGARWSFQRMYAVYGRDEKPRGAGWPDTETGFSRCLQEKGILPLFIGQETNDRVQVDDNLRHVRSFTGIALYNDCLRQEAARLMALALAEGRRNAAAWRRADKPRIPKGKRPGG